MTAAAVTAGPAIIRRIAPSGDAVVLTLPAELGELRWYASTRLTGPGMARQFFVAPRGEHRAIPRHLMPGARERRLPMRGADAVVFEATDRSDAALVVVGPHHEATTWFGGPAPDPAGLAGLLAAVRFADAPAGAALTPASDLLVRQAGVTLIGRGARSTVLVRGASDALPSLPAWAGAPVPGGELWRVERVLAPQVAATVAGTAHEWRYLLASETAVVDVVLHGPESRQPPVAEPAAVAALSAVAARWGA
jgi:hypothetical protein